MTAKNQLVAMIDFMEEDVADQILQYAKDTFLLKHKTWDDVEEDDPLPDEIAIFEAYHANK